MMRSWTLARGAAAVVAATLASVALPQVRATVIGLLPKTWGIALSAWRHGITVDHGVMITMPDGVRLAASLYRPRAANAPLPSLLVRLPYDRLQYGEGYNTGLYFSRHGYAVVVQDLRGTGASGGELLPWHHAADDGVATLDWIVAQPWSNGKVGTFGCSALGETQMILAARNHPAHRAMVASGAGGAVGSALGRGAYFGLFEGGVFQLASGFGWFVESGARSPRAPPARAFNLVEHLRGLPVSSLVAQVRPAPNGYSDFMTTPLDDPRWSTERGYLSDTDRIDVPALVINSWGDQTVGDTLAYAEQTRERQQAAGRLTQKVIIAPASHCHHEEVGDGLDHFGVLEVRNASRPWKDWYLRWFDHWLFGRGDGLADLPAYTYFMLVDNHWHQADQWPPAQARADRWYLGSAGIANSSSGDGRLSVDALLLAASDGFRYDPADPAPSRGGPVCCTGDPLERAGPADQTDVEARADVLVYTSAPLSADLRIAGPLTAHLAFSSDVPDTDVVARLAHVWPDGHSTSIQEGALRLRFRQGLSGAPPLRPGEPVQVQVDMRSIAYRVPRGHRLRLQVTSSAFPRLERHLNGGGRNADVTTIAVASSRVHYGPRGDASYLTLYTLPIPP